VKFRIQGADGAITLAEPYLMTERGFAFDKDSVMADVDEVLALDTHWQDLVRFFVPLAFRLLCLAAFREDAKCNVRAADNGSAPR
jgi:hypothetical protein